MLVARRLVVRVSCAKPGHQTPPVRIHRKQHAFSNFAVCVAWMQNAKKVHPHSANARKVCTDYLCTRTRTHSLAPDVAIHSSIRVRQTPRWAMAPPGPDPPKNMYSSKLGMKQSTSPNPLARKPGT